MGNSKRLPEREREYRLMLEHTRQALVDLLGDVSKVLEDMDHDNSSMTSPTSETGSEKVHDLFP